MFQTQTLIAESFGYFHGVICYSSIYLPAGVNGVLLVDGSVAQPVLSKQYKAEKNPSKQRLGDRIIL